MGCDPSFEFCILGGEFDADNDNVDVELRLSGGEVFYATLFYNG